MPDQPANLTISPRIAALVLTVAFVGIGVVTWNSLLAKERRDNPVRVFDKAYCIKCHANDQVLSRMQWKEGKGGLLTGGTALPADSVHTLFNTPKKQALNTWLHAPAIPSNPPQK